MNALTETNSELAEWNALGLGVISERAAVATLGYCGLGAGDYEISILGTDDATIARLNADFRDKPTPTNVLSWPSAERAPLHPGDTPAPPEPGELGDIAIAFQTCAREAGDQGIALGDHTSHLIVHAVLHLLGYDHEDDDDAALMEGHTSAILIAMGIASPYV
jgi:probable rRNA maturation factor